VGNFEDVIKNDFHFQKMWYNDFTLGCKILSTGEKEGGNNGRQSNIKKQRGYHREVVA
jgi:hypothetical protein